VFFNGRGCKMNSTLICGQNMIHESNRSTLLSCRLHNKILPQAIPFHPAEINLVIIIRICCIIFLLKKFIVMVFHLSSMSILLLSSFNVQTQFTHHYIVKRATGRQPAQQTNAASCLRHSISSINF
jgi:hypothetical protein